MATDKKLIELQSRSQASGVGDEDLIYVVRVVGGSGIGEYKLTSVELYNFIKSKLDSLSAFLTDVNWGDINGTIAAQTDLQNALNAKADLVGGKLKADQIPLIALHDMIVAAEANITAFIANVGSYTFEQGDEIFLNTANPQRRYHFTGGDNTDVGNYIEKITGDIDWAHILNKVDATTSAKGIVQLVDNANSTSVLLAPTANALRLVKLLVDSVEEDLADFIARTDNPHSVTKAQVGLGNADNTSDMNKPVSTAQQAAIDLKANKLSVEAESNLGDGSTAINLGTTNQWKKVVKRALNSNVTNLVSFSNGVEGQLYELKLSTTNNGFTNIGFAATVKTKDGVPLLIPDNGGTHIYTIDFDGTNYWIDAQYEEV